MKKLLTVLTLSLFVIQAQAQKQGKCNIQLNAKGFEQVSLLSYNIKKNKNKLIAEESLKDGKLNKDFSIEDNHIYVLKLSEEDAITLVIRDGEKININYHNMDKFQISGSKESQAIKATKDNIEKIKKNISIRLPSES